MFSQLERERRRGKERQKVKERQREKERHRYSFKQIVKKKRKPCYLEMKLKNQKSQFIDNVSS